MADYDMAPCITRPQAAPRYWQWEISPCLPWGKSLLSGEPDYFGRKKISSGGDLSHYSSASLY